MSTPRQSEDTVVQTLDQLSLSSMGCFMLFDEVNEFTSRALCEFIIKGNLAFERDQPLTIFVNSPGRSVHDGWAIVDTMATSKNELQTVGIGLIASMAVSVLISGTKGRRMMTRHSHILTHQFSSGIYGKQHELVAARRVHDKIEEQFIKHYMKHSTLSEKQIRDILLRESDTWLEPKEVLKFGMCDKIVESPYDEIKKPHITKKKPPKK